MKLPSISPESKRNLFQILPFGVISFFASVVYSLLEKGILGDHPIYPSTGNPYTFSVIIPSIVALFFGLLMGSLECFYLSKWFKKDSFAKKMTFKGILYFILVIIFAILVSCVSTASELRASPVSPKVWKFTSNFISSFAFWTIQVYITVGIILSLFYVEVSNNMGQEISWNFFTGKYHHPIEEERIFMFLDMKSSTTIAEKLGHIHYFDLLQEYYADLSAPIIRHGGAIYQYVGDEVVLNWKYNKGGNNTSCIECFFAMKTHLASQAQKYQAKYGIIPSFKAGVHMGQVTTGEIGVIKKDIVFSGDVLNTTARIQALCNQYQTDFLASEELVQRIALQKPFVTQSIGSIRLKGKEKQVDLCTISKEG